MNRQKVHLLGTVLVIGGLLCAATCSASCLAAAPAAPAPSQDSSHEGCPAPKGSDPGQAPDRDCNSHDHAAAISKFKQDGGPPISAPLLAGAMAAAQPERRLLASPFAAATMNTASPPAGFASNHVALRI